MHICVSFTDHLEQFRSTKSKNNYEGIRRQSVSKLAEIWPESTSLTQNEEQTLSPDILLFTMAFIRTVANLSTGKLSSEVNDKNTSIKFVKIRH